MIITNNSTKELYRWHIAKALGNEGIDSYAYYQEIVAHLLSIPEIKKNVIEEIGIDKFRVLQNRAFRFRGYYFESLELRTMIKDVKAPMGREADFKFAPILNRLKKIQSTIPPIQIALMQLFTLCINSTDLVRIRVPSQDILNAKGDKNPFKVGDTRYVR